MRRLRTSLFDTDSYRHPRFPRYASRASLISRRLALNNAMAPDEEIAYLKAALEAAQSEIGSLRGEVAGLKAELGRS